jgi:hypothetical protein
MASSQDSSVGVVEEVVYGTSPGAVTRWPEFTDAPLDWKPNRKQGAGLRVGGRVARSGRRVTTSVEGSGSIEMEVVSKGMGLFWKWALGAATSTLVTAGVYQQVATFADIPASFALQQGLPEAGGTVDASTFLGCMVDSWELDFPNDDIVKVKYALDARDLNTAIAYAPPSYVANPVNQFHFAGGSVATGALTAPTTMALGSALTPIADIISGSLAVNNNLKSIKPLGGLGKKNKPTAGLRAITGKLGIDYDSVLFRDAFINDTPMSLVLTWTAGPLTTGLETLQVILPEIKFDGDLPRPAGTDRIAQSMTFQGLDNLVAAQPLWVVTRTADAAL